MARNPVVDVPNADLVIAEARRQCGTACYVIDEAGKEYGPNPIEWHAHYDFGPGRFWCDAQVGFGVPPGVYVRYRAVTDNGTVVTIGMINAVRIGDRDSLTIRLRT